MTLKRLRSMLDTRSRQGLMTASSVVTTGSNVGNAMQMTSQKYIKSTQRGVVKGSATINIKKIDMGKTFINSNFKTVGRTTSNKTDSWENKVHQHWSWNNYASRGYGYGYGYGFGRAGSMVELVSPTQIKITANDSDTKTYYEVIEYE